MRQGYLIPLVLGALIFIVLFYELTRKKSSTLQASRVTASSNSFNKDDNKSRPSFLSKRIKKEFLSPFLTNPSLSTNLLQPGDKIQLANKDGFLKASRSHPQLLSLDPRYPDYEHEWLVEFSPYYPSAIRLRNRASGQYIQQNPKTFQYTLTAAEDYGKHSSFFAVPGKHLSEQADPTTFGLLEVHSSNQFHVPSFKNIRPTPLNGYSKCLLSISSEKPNAQNATENGWQWKTLQLAPQTASPPTLLPPSTEKLANDFRSFVETDIMHPLSL